MVDYWHISARFEHMGPWILIPPFLGSNPSTPATFSAWNSAKKEDWRTPDLPEKAERTEKVGAQKPAQRTEGES